MLLLRMLVAQWTTQTATSESYSRPERSPMPGTVDGGETALLDQRAAAAAKGA